MESTRLPVPGFGKRDVLSVFGCRCDNTCISVSNLFCIIRWIFHVGFIKIVHWSGAWSMEDSPRKLHSFIYLFCAYFLPFFWKFWTNRLNMYFLSIFLEWWYRAGQALCCTIFCVQFVQSLYKIGRIFLCILGWFCVYTPDQKQRWLSAIFVWNIADFIS